MLAEVLYIDYRTNVLVKNDLVNEILFPSLQMLPYSNITFDFNKAASITVKYRRHFSVDATSILDFTKISHSTVFKSV
jgi:hypothetical protein